MTLHELGEWLIDWQGDQDKEVYFLDPLPFGAKIEELTIQSDRSLGDKVVITNNCEIENENQKDLFEKTA